MAFDASYECHIQLDDVGLKISEEVQARVSGAEVINRKIDAVNPVSFNLFEEVINAVDDLILENFEHDTIGLDTNFFRCFND